MKRVDALTDEQKAKFPEYVKRWLDIGLSIDPCDKKKAQEAVVEAYQVAGQRPPEIFIWLESPILGEVVPPVVLLFPAVVAQTPNHLWREGLRVQRGDPQPFMVSGLGFELAAAVIIMSLARRWVEEAAQTCTGSRN